MTDNDQAREALNPCPFCGSNDLVIDAGRSNFVDVEIECQSCFTSSASYDDSETVIENRQQAIEAWNRRAPLQHEAIPAWLPIETPPPSTSGASIRVLCAFADGGITFGQYTPYYLGHPDEDEFLWIGSNRAWLDKPTHWMPLPAAPLPAQIKDE